MPAHRELTTDEEWERAIPIVRQLWSHEDEAFVRSWREEDDYRLYGRFVDDDLVAVAGVSIQRVLHHVRHLWIHDFVVAEAHRGEGHGAAFLEWLEDWARERDCEYVALACWGENDDAHEFYAAQGLEEWGSVLEREL